MSSAKDEFRPFPLLANAHVQTILATYRFTREPKSERRLLDLDDGDQLAVEVTTPEAWTPRDRTVVMVHGLCGCHGSAYLVRLASKMHRRGMRAVRVNLRGCGSGAGFARGIYHSGRSEDMRRVVEVLRQECPEGRLDLIGFSLGGNISLKLAGELADDGGDWLDQVIGICPPVDLAACARMLGEAWKARYERFFVKLLYQAVAERRARFPDIGPVDLPESPAGVSIHEFDDLYTAKFGGFESADDYYARASARPLLEKIRVPCRILFAEDDPFIDANACDDLDLPANVEVEKTRRGGHLGFLGSPFRRGGFRWMDSRIFEWLEGRSQ